MANNDLSGVDLSGYTIYGFEPRPWQSDFISSTAREVLGSGAFGSGKSRALGEKLVLLLTVYPGNKGLLARNTLKALKNTTMVTLEEEVLPDAWIVDELTNKQKQVIAIQSPYYPSSYCPECGLESDERVHGAEVTCPACSNAVLKAVPASLLYYDGLQTTDEAEIPENILSLELGVIAVDEAKDITEEAWQALNGRLRLERLNNPYVPTLPFRTIFSATNPADPNHWLYKRFFDSDSKNREVYQSSTRDNLDALPDEYLETLHDQYGEDTAEAKRYIEGEWVGYEGLVYDEWDETLHEISPLDVEERLGENWSVENTDELLATRKKYSNPIGNPQKPGEYTPARVKPPGCPVYMGIDWGYRPDPLVIQWWAETPTHGIVLYRSWMKTRILPDDAAKEALSYMTPTEVSNVKRVFADHDPGNHRAWLEGAKEYCENTSIKYNHLQTTNAEKARSEGITEVKRLMRPDENGRAGLYVIRGNLCHQPDRHMISDDRPVTLTGELRGYGYVNEESGDAQDYDDHHMDCKRYVAMSRKKHARWSDALSTWVSSSSGNRRGRSRRRNR